MKRIAVLLGKVFLLVVGCSGGFADDDLKKEAENVAMQELNKYVVKCGDDYYYHDVDENLSAFTQTKKVQIYVNETTSEADRLNGLEWRGDVSLKSEGVERFYFVRAKWFVAPPASIGHWLDWQTPESPTAIVVSTFTKKEGKWLVELFGENTPITCSDIPQ